MQGGHDVPAGLWDVTSPTSRCTTHGVQHVAVPDNSGVQCVSPPRYTCGELDSRPTTRVRHCLALRNTRWRAVRHGEVLHTLQSEL